MRLFSPCQGIVRHSWKVQFESCQEESKIVTLFRGGDAGMVESIRTRRHQCGHGGGGGIGGPDRETIAHFVHGSSVLSSSGSCTSVIYEGVLEG